jgi:hypothetical protein
MLAAIPKSNIKGYTSYHVSSLSSDDRPTGGSSILISNSISHQRIFLGDFNAHRDLWFDQRSDPADRNIDNEERNLRSTPLNFCIFCLLHKEGLGKKTQAHYEACD